MRCHCGGRTRRVRTCRTRLGFRQTRKCTLCGDRIYLRAIIERVVKAPAPPSMGFAAGSSSPISVEDGTPLPAIGTSLSHANPDPTPRKKEGRGDFPRTPRPMGTSQGKRVSGS